MSLLSMMKRSGADVVAIRYRAFVSCSHRDARWGKWLRAQLEGFRASPELVGRQTPLGPVARTLRPIFRDGTDYSGSDALTDATIAALDQSAALVVICSPSVAGRTVVNREVRAFRTRHPDRPVIPVIVGGTVPDNLPGAVRFEFNADGTLDRDRPITVNAPDLRQGGAGRGRALAEIIAGLTGLTVDEVDRCAQRTRRRRRSRWAGVAGFVLLASLATAGGAAYAWRSLTTDDAVLAATLGPARNVIERAVSAAGTSKMTRGAMLALLGKADALLATVSRLEPPTPQLKYREARVLIELARSYQVLGDNETMRARAGQAYRAMAGLDAELAAQRRDLARSYQQIGDMLLDQGVPTEALRSYRDGNAVLRRLAAADPAHSGWQRLLAVSSEKAGDALVQLGQWPEALASYNEAKDVFERLAGDAADTRSQWDLAASLSKIGDLLLVQNLLPEALESFREGQDLFERLAFADPGNRPWQRDLAASAIKIGDVLLAQGLPAKALASYREGEEIIEGLLQADPDNVSWRRDLSAAFAKLAGAHEKAGDHAKAMDALRQGRAIMQRLSGLSPDNAPWKRDLAWFDRQIADAASATKVAAGPRASGNGGPSVPAASVRADAK